MVKFCVIREANQVISLVESMKLTYTEVFLSIQRLVLQLTLCVCVLETDSLEVFQLFFYSFKENESLLNIDIDNFHRICPPEDFQEVFN